MTSKGMNKTVVISGAVSAMWLIGAVVFLIATGKDATVLISFVTPYLTLLIPTLINSLKVTQASETLDVVRENVNGHLSALAQAAGITPGDTALTRSGDPSPQQPS